MSKSEAFRRYFVLAIGVIILAFGIMFTTKAGLGTSTLASFPYVWSHILPVSVGVCLFTINMIYVIIEIIITKGKLPKYQYLQVAVAFLFSVGMDAFNALLNFEPSFYPVRILMVVIGCAFTALGISIELQANVLIMPAEGIIREIAKVSGWNQGYIKLAQDIILVVLAVITSFVFLHELWGVREGTVIAAFIIGPMVKFFNPRLAFLNRSFFPDKAKV